MQNTENTKTPEKFCRSCGELLDGRFRFCPICGTESATTGGKQEKSVKTGKPAEPSPEALKAAKAFEKSIEDLKNRRSNKKKNGFLSSGKEPNLNLLIAVGVIFIILMMAAFFYFAPALLKLLQTSTGAY